MMEGFESSSDSFVDVVFSWSLEDILNENFYQHQVAGLGKSPQSFGSDLLQYFGSYIYPLLDETRSELQSKVETIHGAPFGKVISIEACARNKLCDVKVDCWRNNVSKEPYETRPGDLFILADAKPETVSDLLKEGRSWVFLIATELFPIDQSEDNTTCLRFRVKASKEFDINSGIQTPLFIIYLENIAPNMRIWKAMHMCTDATHARWKVTFSDNFLKSFNRLTSIRTKLSVVSLLLKLSTGWRGTKRNAEIVCVTSSMVVKKFKVQGLYILCSTDIIKHLRYMQVLKVWDILPDLCAIQTLVNHLDLFFVRYTAGFIKLCCEKYFEGDLEVPMTWPPSLDIVRYKDLSMSQDDSSVEGSKFNQSLLLMKFYSLSSGVVNHLLSDREGTKMDLPFEVTDEEMDAILYGWSTFIVGRSGTGKTTVLSMKLYQNEEGHNMAEEALNGAEESSVLRQIFVTVSPKLCFAVKQHVLHLKSFSSGGSHSSEFSLFDMDDFDAEEAQFGDIPNSFLDLPLKIYPLFITFSKFLMMLDGSLGNSYFERFLEKLNLPHGSLECSRSVLLQTVMRTKEVNYDKFYSSYWPHFNIQITKKLDASRVFTEIISHIKGGLEALEASDGICSRDCYVKMSGRASNLSEENKEIIYDIFQVYEKMKLRNGEFDIADFVNDIHRRLKHENYRGDEMDYVYIDEVQDLTMSQVALFKHICSNVDEGFVFSGDTAQTISKGIDFRFEDIRHLFYKKFMLESGSNKHEKGFGKAKISNKFHLTQNFRTHNGILKLSQSIIDLLYHFFPQYIDPLNPETSPVHGEAPVLLESGEDENENMIGKLFGSNSTSGSIVGFGAEQVILVRDSCARKEISNFVGKQALVLTILESKGLEFQDVILYDFFGSSSLKQQWRLIYEYMKENELLDPRTPEKFPSFNGGKHHLLCSELKQLYVAVTRTKQRLWIYEKMADICSPMFDFWKKKCLIQVRQIDDSLVEKMKVESTPEEWRMRGMKLYHQHNYELATMCFEKAHDINWERKSRASGLKVLADCTQSSNPEKARSFLREAAITFEDIGMANSAANCFFDLGDYERAGRIYLDKCGEQGLERAAECFYLAGSYEDAANIFESIERPEYAARCFCNLGMYVRAATIYMEKCGEPGLQKAGECFSLAERYDLAADVYARGKLFSECLTACLVGDLFDIGLQYIKDWKQHAREEYGLAIREKGTDKTELKFLERCAVHYYDEVDNIRPEMKLVRAELFSSQKILNSHLSSSSKYLWEEKSPDDMIKCLEVKESKKQFSVDSLVYFWNLVKDKIVYLIKYFDNLEDQDVNKKRCYGDLFLNYLGVWRDFHDDLKPVYVSLMSDDDWVTGKNKRYILMKGELVTIDYFQILLDSRNFWSSKLISCSIKVLNKLEELYKFIIKKSDSVSFQSWTLNQVYVAAKMYAVAKCVLGSKFLNDEDLNTLRKFVDLSAESIVACIFPFDWRKTLRGNMILLRQSDAFKKLLKQLVVDYTSSTIELSYGQVGRLAMIILGSGSVDSELHEKLVKDLKCSRPWELFILNMCGSIIGVKKGSVHVINTRETRCNLVRQLHQALVETYHTNWRTVFDYISPNGFLYLTERLLMLVSSVFGRS
uniref:uncharacterized protein LOC101298122 n=1 Tax=Fragaria vesca subsp. vesca TaxID=101020 RepID=UPI0005C86C10|nr:PREDICTED: uncharacterized protein LOC101298122 [Fragaria vesca subsp. vesca]